MKHNKLFISLMIIIESLFWSALGMALVFFVKYVFEEFFQYSLHALIFDLMLMLMPVIVAGVIYQKVMTKYQNAFSGESSK